MYERERERVEKEWKYFIDTENGQEENGGIYVNKSIYKLCKVRKKKRVRKKEGEGLKRRNRNRSLYLSLSSSFSFFNFFLSFLRSRSKGLQRSIVHSLDILEYMG